MVRVRAERGPAALDVELVGFGEPGRQADLVAVLGRALRVADAVQRREHVLRQLRRLAEDRIDHVGRRRLEGRQAGEAADVGDGVEHEALLGERGGVGHAWGLWRNGRPPL